ncbi:DUF4935 domain-containing protein [Pseudanabaena biceps]|nr:DUF4935 domain-containing protein [Pseudanabaena biceps]
MKNLFSEYYQLTEEEFKKLWDESIFSFDANILLHVYRFTPQTRQKFIEILTKLNGRVWISHQVAYEYQSNRVEVIIGQLNAYDKVISDLDKSFKIEEITKSLSQFKRHSYIDTKFIKDTLSNAIEIIKNKLKESKDNHPSDLLINDPYRDVLDNIFDGKIGSAYGKEDLKDKYKSASERFKMKIPPGFKNIDKPEPERYGDVVLWFQLIDYAVKEKKSIIFITDENQEDWWLDVSGKRIGSRPELIKEFMEKTGQRIHIYSSDKFIQYASNFLEPKLDKAIIEEAVKEARDIRLMLPDNLEESVKDTKDKSLMLSKMVTASLPMFLDLLKKHKEEKSYPTSCPECDSSNAQVFKHKGVAPTGESANVIRLVCSNCGIQRIIQYEPVDY